YDRTRPLRIDRVLSYSTYLGGNGTERVSSIAVDSAGSADVAGVTDSSNFPVTRCLIQSVSRCRLDAIVTKLNAAGRQIVYSTYLGGSLDDRGSAIAVDTSGAAYIAGNTNSTNFPIAAAVQSSISGSQDAFITKFNSGGALVYSTYLGGSAAENIEIGGSIAV